MADFVHPSVSSRIIDNDVVFSTASGTTKLFAAYFSGKGVDRKTRRYSTPEEFIFFNGEPDMAKYGQQAYNVVNWLTNEGEVFGLRLTAEDATYANLVADIKVKSTVEPVSGDDQYVIKPTVVAVANAIESSVLTTIMNDPIVTPDVDGFASHKIFALIPRGRGAEYASLGMRLIPFTSLADTYDFMLYELDIVEKVNGAEMVRETFTVSLDPDARSTSRESMFIKDVVDRFSKYFTVLFSEKAYDRLSTSLGGVDPKLVNIVNNSSLFDNKTLAALITEASGNDSTVTYDATADNLMGIHYLQKGSDGVVDANKMDQLLIKAFSGIVDPDVRNKKAMEIDAVLDSNESLAVKNAIADFATDIRGDLMAFLDTNFTANYEQALQFRSTFPVSSRNVSIWTQDFVVYDEYTGRNIRVTLPYFLASKIVANDNDYGVGKPFVGPRRGVISGFVAEGGISWLPNEPQKSELYMKQVNYVEQDPDKTYIGTQQTSLQQSTPMQNVSVARCAFRMVRKAERIADDYRFEFFNDETYKGLQNNIQENLNVFVNAGFCEYVKVEVYASEYEKATKKCNVTITVKFTDIIERISIGFVVKR